MVTTSRWSPPVVPVVLGWVLAAAAAAGTTVVTHRAGQLLLVVATVALVLLALHGTFVRPRLVADEAGVRVRGLTGTRKIDWSDLYVRVRRTSRLGRITSTLELESGETLLVLGRIDLGAEPEDVADTLREYHAP